MHVAFYDTRKRGRNWAGILRVAETLKGPGVKQYAVLDTPFPVVPSYIQAIRLRVRSELGVCLQNNLVRLAHGPGRAYILKVLLHFVLPTRVHRVLVMDTDIVVIRPLKQLWKEFSLFGADAVIGLVNEQSLSLYPPNIIGKNGGVQLLDLNRMRRSHAYNNALDHFASGFGGVWVGFLGDQTLYSFMAVSHRYLFRTLGCEWNRQLSLDRGVKAMNLHPCSESCGVLHGNSPSMKCVITAFQAYNGSCQEWQSLQHAPPPHCFGLPRGAFQKAVRKHFSDCCIPDVPEGG